MSNLIITSGFGETSGISSYSDIDWSKEVYSLSFDIARYEEIFDIKTTAVNFSIKIVGNLFNINTYNGSLNIVTHDISFTAHQFE